MGTFFDNGPIFGVVTDNADPDGLGRVKVKLTFYGEDIETNWIPVMTLYGDPECGAFFLPEIEDQVVVVFLNNNPEQGIVLGSVWSEAAPPPETGENTASDLNQDDENNLKFIKSRSGHQIILDDKDGEEKLLIHTKDGAMRLVLDPAKGLSMVNENGDISIKSAKDVVFKAKSKINIKGNTGVTAGVQQMAKKDDQVVGIDLHDIQVPTNTGLMTVPMIPHPYLGKLADALSQDVMINDKPAATKGSKSKYSTPGHVCMPPKIKFKKNPSNEGEVSSGTVGNVKINGKEAAVLGSMVKTCNDF